MTRSSRATRFDPVSPFVAPQGAIRVAEKRVGGMVERFNWSQTFSATLIGSTPRPTLLDLVVSAYLQGIEDTIQTCVMKNINLLEGSDEHEHRRSEAVLVPGGNVEGADATGVEGVRSVARDTSSKAPTRSDGPHAPESEFGMPLW